MFSEPLPLILSLLFPKLNLWCNTIFVCTVCHLFTSNFINCFPTAWIKKKILILIFSHVIVFSNKSCCFNRHILDWSAGAYLDKFTIMLLTWFLFLVVFFSEILITILAYFHLFILLFLFPFFILFILLHLLYCCEGPSYIFFY